MNNKDYDMSVVIDLAARTNILEDRFDRHLVETRDEVKILRSTVGEVKDALSNFKVEVIKAISEVHQKHMEDDKATNIKLYSMNGMVSMIVTSLTLFFSKYFKD